MITQKLILVRHCVPEHLDYFDDPGLHASAANALTSTVEIVGDEIGSLADNGGLLIATSERRRTRETAAHIATALQRRGISSDIFSTSLLNDDNSQERYSEESDLDEFEARSLRLKAYMELLREIEEKPHAVDSEVAVVVTHESVIRALSMVIPPTIQDFRYGGVTVLDLDP